MQWHIFFPCSSQLIDWIGLKAISVKSEPTVTFTAKPRQIVNYFYMKKINLLSRYFLEHSSIYYFMSKKCNRTKRYSPICPIWVWVWVWVPLSAHFWDNKWYQNKGILISKKMLFLAERCKFDCFLISLVLHVFHSLWTALDWVKIA